MKLIDDIRDDWKVATKWASVRLSGLGVVLTGAWAVMPADLRAQMPYLEIVAPLLFALVIFGRVTTNGTGKGGGDNGE